MTCGSAGDMKAFCAAVDWGTSRFRLWALSEAGAVLGERQSEQGMTVLRPDEFEDVLEAHLRTLGLADDLPVVICGMAGAAQGWKEAPYLDLPARLAEVPRAAVSVPSAGRDVRILPGLAQRDPARPDVIRGEETLLLGVLELGAVEGTVCLPGTHSKWVEVSAGVVLGFRTAMTGELFALLAQQSTLSHAVAGAASVEADHPAFSAAVGEALDRPESVSGALFSVRANALLRPASPDDAAARLSGLLIGLEVAGARSRIDHEVTLASSGQLARLYACALTIAGLPYRLREADELVRAGLLAAARTLWPVKGRERVGAR